MGHTITFIHILVLDFRCRRAQLDEVGIPVFHGTLGGGGRYLFGHDEGNHSDHKRHERRGRHRERRLDLLARTQQDFSQYRRVAHPLAIEEHLVHTRLLAQDKPAQDGRSTAESFPDGGGVLRLE
ncbi:hypothetical protein H310_03147 [Aphanomyces invadans]|uniref:Uncharacterized protein n=1 Tax=Aphanomyces invadans TaxID=157072 RepID=A0A024ULM0_9STRA|nr:hypothetical protein H310_03147 [Aphanomyces invadans]ETW07075.1 hypothetical protein H310_03147 [Aphanomyces invadans]|eukprot:XP_008865150.1 hypothetical protein H310_03147 [Aphanomyces invadans]